MTAAENRVVVVREHGGFDKLEFETRPMPEPGPGEVRVRVEAAALNHLDLWVRHGVPGHRFPLPLVPGSDGTGVVDATGPGVNSCHEGDEVMILPGVSCGLCAPCLRGDDMLCAGYDILGESRDGTCADYLVVPAGNVAPRPPSMPVTSAAAFGLVFLTANHMLRRRAQVQPGETVLVLGGASGVGSAAIQLAKCFGTQVIATASTQEKLDLCTELGADHVVQSTDGDFVDGVRGIVGRSGVDVVFEHSGRATFDSSVRCLRRGGRLVTCGATTGPEVQVDLRVLFFKSLSYLGSTMGRKADLLELFDWAADGRLKTVVGRVLPMAEIAEGHRAIEAREVLGKVVLTAGA